MVCVLLIAGDHVPVMPLVEVVGNAGMVAPAQYDVGVMLKVGVTFELIVIVTWAVVAHCPVVGVKV